MHIYEKNEHVGIIEQSIFTIKEHTIATCHAIPFKRYTNIVTRSLIDGVVDLLNRFPSKYRMSDTLRPSTIVEVRLTVYMVQKNIAFGSYAMVHISTTNKMKIRCVPAI